MNLKYTRCCKCGKHKYVDFLATCEKLGSRICDCILFTFPHPTSVKQHLGNTFHYIMHAFMKNVLVLKHKVNVSSFFHVKLSSPCLPHAHCRCRCFKYRIQERHILHMHVDEYVEQKYIDTLCSTVISHKKCVYFCNTCDICLAFESTSTLLSCRTYRTQTGHLYLI